MKTLKALCAATLLALSLSISAFADTNPGEGHSPGLTMIAQDGLETPTQEPADTFTTGVVTTVDGDGSIVLLADIVWALALMF